MICRYCTAKNEDDDHRCRRCGRRMHTDTRAFPATNSSLAPAFDLNAEAAPERAPQPVPGPRIVPTPAPNAEPRTNREPVIQASLFGPQEVPVARESAPRPASKPTAAPKPKLDRPAQTSLDFTESTLSSQVQASIFCNAVVAPAPLRVAAVLFDFLYPALATALFWAVLHFGTPALSMLHLPVWLYGAVAGASFVLYRVLYCAGNADTPGVRWAGLKLLDFDGRKPSREQRIKRALGGAVSIIAAGLGLIWALFDEERLTWHDHMSGTFAVIADQNLFSPQRHRTGSLS